MRAYQNTSEDFEQLEQTPGTKVPVVIVDEPEQNPRVKHQSEEDSTTETEMSSHRSHHSSSSSKGKGHSSSSKSHGKKDDWSEITDPEERRRVQNRLAQRKFRDKAKEAKERQEREAENRAHAASSYVTPDPNEMGDKDELSGLPWGSLNLRHVVSRGRAREEEPRRESRMDDDRSHYDERSYYDESGHYEAPAQPVYSEGDTYYDADATYYEQEEQPYEDQTYYDYRSGSGSGRGS